MGKVKIQNNLNFSLDATTVDATTVDATTVHATTDTWQLTMVAISSDDKWPKMSFFSYILL